MIDKFDGEYRFLSNFYFPADVEYEGILYPTSEHAYQAAKTLDRNWREQIAGLDKPYKTKVAGNALLEDARYGRADFHDLKVEIMEDIVRIKFVREPLKSKLLETGKQELVEGNTWHDNFWGNCSCRKCAQINGENNLGKILMKVREELSAC